MANPPRFDPARRNARVGPQQLPAEGRPGRAPAWPLPGRMRTGELAAWRELWRTPQAVQWERLSWTRTVARYCRVMVQAEKTLDAKDMAEARQLEDRLGLTPKAMRLMLWTIVGERQDSERSEEQQRADAEAAAAEARSQFQAVDGGAGA